MEKHEKIPGAIFAKALNLDESTHKDALVHEPKFDPYTGVGEDRHYYCTEEFHDKWYKGELNGDEIPKEFKTTVAKLLGIKEEQVVCTTREEVAEYLRNHLFYQYTFFEGEEKCVYLPQRNEYLDSITFGHELCPGEENRVYKISENDGYSYTEIIAEHDAEIAELVKGIENAEGPFPDKRYEKKRERSIWFLILAALAKYEDQVAPKDKFIKHIVVCGLLGAMKKALGLDISLPPEYEWLTPAAGELEKAIATYVDSETEAARHVQESALNSSESDEAGEEDITVGFDVDMGFVMSADEAERIYSEMELSEAELVTIINDMTLYYDFETFINLNDTPISYGPSIVANLLSKDNPEIKEYCINRIRQGLPVIKEGQNND